MATVYLLGAGASRGYSGSRTSVVPPLANDFFSTFSKLLISADLQVKIGWIANYIQDTRNIPLELQPTDFDENVEAVFAELDRELRKLFDEDREQRSAEFISQRFNLVKTFDQFVFWFSHVLNEIQNGRVCDIYTTLVDRLIPGDNVITFNWDTLLDRAFDQTFNWFPDDGYGVSFNQILDKTWREPNLTKSDYLLLKLHGSTNWLGGYVTRHLQSGERTWATVEETAYKHWCVVDGTEWFSTYKDRWRPAYAPYSYFFAPNDPIADLPLMPVLIPPKEEKDFNEYGAIFRPIWMKAHEILQAADSLVIVGYSFPQTDTHALSLLSSFIEKQPGRKKNIHVVDPWADDIVAKLRPFVGQDIQLTGARQTFAEYLETNTSTPQYSDEFEKTEAEATEQDQSEEDKETEDELLRMDFVIDRLCFCNLNAQYLDVTTYDGRRFLNCKVGGEYATHMLCAYRPEVLEYRIQNVPLNLESGEQIVISARDIWVILPIGPEPLTEDKYVARDMPDLPPEVVDMVVNGYHCKPDEADLFLKRFDAI